MKGASPRRHDHRGRWDEMLDACTSSNGTMESANPTFPTEIGLPGRINPFDGEQVAKFTGGILRRLPLPRTPSAAACSPSAHLDAALWNSARTDLGEHIEVLVNDAVLGVTHDLDTELTGGEHITLLGQFMGG